MLLSSITLPRFLQREGKVEMKTMRKRKPLMLHALFHYFALTSDKKCLLQEENVIVLIRRFACSLMRGDYMLQFY